MQIIQCSTNDLIPYTQNARTHSDEQIKQIAASIKEFGWTNPILIKSDYTVIAGHGRLFAARHIGMTEVPCIVLDGLSDAQCRALVIADNKLALNAGWDFDMLAAELSELARMDFDVSLTGFSDDELSELIKGLDDDAGRGGDAVEDDFDVDQAADEIKEPVTRRGDVWLLGEHVLMCGDSANAEDVLTLMGGTSADMMFTDPLPAKVYRREIHYGKHH